MKNLLITLMVLLIVLAAGTALAAAVLFAVHQFHSEAVANVVGRADLLVALEPMEGTRALRKLSRRTTALINTRPLLPASRNCALGVCSSLLVRVWAR